MGGRTGWHAQRLRRRPCRAQMAPEEPESEETETADQKRRWRINFGHPKCWIIRCGRRTALKSLLRGQFPDFQWAIEIRTAGRRDCGRVALTVGLDQDLRSHGSGRKCLLCVPPMQGWAAAAVAWRPQLFVAGALRAIVLGG